MGGPCVLRKCICFEGLADCCMLLLTTIFSWQNNSNNNSNSNLFLCVILLLCVYFPTVWILHRFIQTQIQVWCFFSLYLTGFQLSIMIRKLTIYAGMINMYNSTWDSQNFWWLHYSNRGNREIWYLRLTRWWPFFLQYSFAKLAGKLAAAGYKVSGSPC